MSITQDSVATKIYSPYQVACGALGGPVGLIYFLWANFTTLKNEKLREKTLIYGGLLILALILIAPYIPQNIPGIFFTAIYMTVAFVFSKKYQMSKSDVIESKEYDFYSNWRVFFFAIACFWCSSIVIMLPLYLLSLLGFGA